jgi:hypothetical protein
MDRVVGEVASSQAEKIKRLIDEYREDDGNEMSQVQC